jgi:hypothetical protein
MIEQAVKRSGLRTIDRDQVLSISLSEAVDRLYPIFTKLSRSGTRPPKWVSSRSPAVYAAELMGDNAKLVKATDQTPLYARSLRTNESADLVGLNLFPADKLKKTLPRKYPKHPLSLLVRAAEKGLDGNFPAGFPATENHTFGERAVLVILWIVCAIECHDHISAGCENRFNVRECSLFRVAVDDGIIRGEAAPVSGQRFRIIVPPHFREFREQFGENPFPHDIARNIQPDCRNTPGSLAQFYKIPHFIAQFCLEQFAEFKVQPGAPNQGESGRWGDIHPREQSVASFHAAGCSPWAQIVRTARKLKRGHGAADRAVCLCAPGKFFQFAVGGQ